MATDREILEYLRRAKDDPSLGASVPAIPDESGLGAALLVRESEAPFVPVPPPLVAEVEQLRYLASRRWVHVHDGAYSISQSGERALDQGLA